MLTFSDSDVFSYLYYIFHIFNFLKFLKTVAFTFYIK